MERDDLVKSWLTAAASGTLLTQKHDPNGVTGPVGSYRTVLTPQMSASLDSFIKGGEYEIRRYSDADYPHGAGFFEVIPKPVSGFSVVGSGIASGSVQPGGSLDRLVFVSGSQQGWHVYADSAPDVAAKINAGRLHLSGSL
jgi:hypothetical protein